MTNRVDLSLEKRRALQLSLSRSRFFLVLGLGLQFETSENPLPATLCTCPKPKAVLKIIWLTSKKESRLVNTNARVLAELKDRRSPNALAATASKIDSAIGALFSHVHHTWLSDLEPYQIPKEFIENRKVNVELLEWLDIASGRNHDFLDPLVMRVGSCVIIPPSLTATIFYLLPFVLQNEDLFDACNFFRSCCSEFTFMDGVVREVLDEPRRGPKNETERLGFEHVVLQALRTVEVIVGEPGKNTDRLHERFRAWGIDPDELIGFRGYRKQRLEDRIRWLQEARDSAAAHGKRRRREPFTLFEAMEAQHLADHVLHRALWFTAESHGREGDESEVAFLLEAMFPNYPGWTRDKRLFQGKRAVDLARTPGGLVSIGKLQERRVKALFRKNPKTKNRSTEI
jgi:hypothetical protein